MKGDRTIDLTSRGPVEEQLLARARMCRALIREREIVREHLGASLCRNAQWDMLLDLYLAELERRTLYQSAVGLDALGTNSSTHRRSKKLARLGVVSIAHDAVDHRRRNVNLASETLLALDKIMDRIIDEQCPSDTALAECR